MESLFLSTKRLSLTSFNYVNYRRLCKQVRCLVHVYWDNVSLVIVSYMDWNHGTSLLTEKPDMS